MRQLMVVESGAVACRIPSVDETFHLNYLCLCLWTVCSYKVACGMYGHVGCSFT
jgi:hypothetical protein